MTTAALCEVCIGEGHAAAVVAIGRCRECKRAFCDSHRARDRVRNVRYTAWCTECQAAKATKETANFAAERAEREEELRRIRECMEILGERGLVPRTREVRKWKKKRFGQGYDPRRTEIIREPIDPAWPIGEVKWEYRFGEGPPDERVSSIPSGITKSLNVVLMSGPNDALKLAGFYRGVEEGNDLTRADVRLQTLKALEGLVNDLGA